MASLCAMNGQDSNDLNILAHGSASAMLARHADGDDGIFQHIVFYGAGAGAGGVNVPSTGNLSDDALNAGILSYATERSRFPAQGAAHQTNRDHLQRDYTAHHADWDLFDGYHGFLPSDQWSPADYTYPSQSFTHGEKFEEFFDAGGMEMANGSTLPAGKSSVEAGGTLQKPARRNSAASSCAGSSCSSQCHYGEQCELGEQCDLGEPCELGEKCEMVEKCELDQRCDASDCADAPICVDECCEVYTCEETKAAATLASFGGDLQTPGSDILPQHQAPHQPHCDGSMTARQAVLQHIVEAHNDPSNQSCVRPCLVDQPGNFTCCPMTCLVGHPQLHSQYPLGAGQVHTAFDEGILGYCSPEALAEDCSAPWMNADELLQHWHMQHSSLLMHQSQPQLPQTSFDTSHHLHQTYISHDQTMRESIPLTSSPATLGQGPSPITPMSGPSSDFPSPPVAASNSTSISATSEPLPAVLDLANGENRCLWCDFPAASPCGQVFNSPKELNLHVIGCHVKQLERTDGYHCGWQGCKRRSEGKKGFPQKSKIERHIQTHTGDKPYECPTCHMTFSAKQALDQHELIHKGSKPLPCGYPGCNKTFRQQSARTMHMRTHTKVKPLECNICGRRFSESSNLSKHRRTHSEIGAFECGHRGCHKTFHRLDQLRRHQKTHEAKAKCRSGGSPTEKLIEIKGEDKANDGSADSASASPDASLYESQ